MDFLLLDDLINLTAESDMVIKQTLLKCMKIEGRVSQGRSTQESVLCKCVYGMHAMNTVCKEKFCNVSLDTVDQP